MKDKVVIVTGASSGIGKAIAAKFGAEGSKVVITGRTKSQLDAAAATLKESGINVLAVLADAASESDCERVVNTTLDHFGRIDILINNAGISMRALFEDLQLDVFRKVIDVNFYGLVYTTKFALPHIIRSRGSIVGISSVNGRRATPERSAYSASKFAMVGFLESLRSEMLDHGVHVLTACPGYTASNIRRSALLANGKTQGYTPADENHMMAPEEVADHIYDSIVRRKRDLLLTLQGKLAVWLNILFPAWMDRKTLEFIRKEEALSRDSSMAQPRSAVSGSQGE
jgi:dehydrogenase/reductase SDR family member 7B